MIQRKRSPIFPVRFKAYAATVWGQITYWDSRVDRGSGSSNNRLPTLGSNKNRPLPYAVVYVYDMDGDCEDIFSSCNETDDDFLGYDIADASGYFYLSGVGTAEDVYLGFHYIAKYATTVQARGIAFGAPVSIVVGTEAQLNIGGDYRRDWNITCWDEDVDCSNQTFVNLNYPTYEAYASILASMIDTDRWAGPLSYNGHNNIYGHWPDGPSAGDCSGVAGHAEGWSYFCVSNQNQLENQIVAHEIGHLVHKRLMDDGNGPLGEGTCANWVGWSDEKCAVSEGWADFFAGATFWTPAASDAFRDADNPSWNYEGYTMAGNASSSRCVSFGTNPDNRLGNVSRWFWDLYDSTTVGDNGNDTKTYSINTIKAQWDYFAKGTGNHETRESGTEGRNAWDVAHYAHAFEDTLVHNCLGNQEFP